MESRPGEVASAIPQISPRSRWLVEQMRLVVKPMVQALAHAPSPSFLAYQAMFPRRRSSSCAGLPLNHSRFGGVSGSVLGDFSQTGKPLLLYLHGGGFYLPVIPLLHLRMHAGLCRALDAVGLMPEYRLAPSHCYPAALDDCEQAYRAALDAGFAPQRIALVGESAGGNLSLALLSRLRRRGLPLPACAVPISAVTDLTGLHALPSRRDNRDLDPLVPMKALARALEFYGRGQDCRDPELSPLYADFSGFPPLYFLAAATEIMLDDSRLAAQRAEAAGVDVRLDIWPVLPHAFPLFAPWFPEARQARRDIAAFIRLQWERQGRLDALRAAAP